MRTCKGEQRHEETETAYVRPAVLLGTALPVWAEDAAAGTPAPDSAGQAEEVAPAAEAQQGRPNEAAPAEAGGVQAPAQPQAAAVPQAEWGTDYEAAEEFTVSTEAELRAFAAMVNGGGETLQAKRWSWQTASPRATSFGCLPELWNLRQAMTKAAIFSQAPLTGGAIPFPALSLTAAKNRRPAVWRGVPVRLCVRYNKK